MPSSVSPGHGSCAPFRLGRQRLSSPQRLRPLPLIDDVLQGVVGLVVEEDFIVEVGAGAVAGVADEGDDLAALDRLALNDLVPLVVAIEGLEAEAVGEDQGVAVAREGAGEGDDPIGRGAEGGAGGGGGGGACGLSALSAISRSSRSRSW